MFLLRSPVLPALIGLVCGAAPAAARLGETREECIKRYGAPLADVPALLEQASGTTFMKGEIRIRIEFLEGRAAFVSFSKRGLRLDERQTLLEVNAGPLTWNAPAEFLGRLCWTAPGTAGETARHASAYQAVETGYLDLATDAWTHAMKAQQAVQFAILPKTPASVLPAGPGNPAAVPPAARGTLDGF